MISEETLIALGFKPRTLKGWIFWLRYWSPPAELYWRLRDQWKKR